MKEKYNEMSDGERKIFYISVGLFIYLFFFNTNFLSNAWNNLKENSGKSLIGMASNIYEFASNTETYFVTAGKLIGSFITNIAKFFWGIIQAIYMFFQHPLDIIRRWMPFLFSIYDLFKKYFIIFVQSLTKLLRPVQMLWHVLFQWFYSLLKFPFKLARKLGILLRKIGIILYVIIKRLFIKLGQMLLAFYDKIKFASLEQIIRILGKPIQMLVDFIRQLKFDGILDFLTKLIHFIITLPIRLLKGIYYWLGRFWKSVCHLLALAGQALIDEAVFLKDYIYKFLKLFIFPVDFLEKLLSFLHIHIIFDILMWILKFPLQLVRSFYRFVVLLFTSFREAMHQIKDTFKSIGDFLVKLFGEGLFKIIRKIVTAPFKVIEHILDQFRWERFRLVFTYLLYIPKQIFLFFQRSMNQLLLLAKKLVFYVLRFINTIILTIIEILKKLSSFSIWEFIKMLIDPIIKILDALSKIPILNVVIKLLRVIIYSPIWIFSWLLRSMFYLYQSLLNYVVAVSGTFTMNTITDMWDNACWPYDAEKCKQLMGQVPDVTEM